MKMSVGMVGAGQVRIPGVWMPWFANTPAGSEESPGSLKKAPAFSPQDLGRDYIRPQGDSQEFFAVFPCSAGAGVDKGEKELVQKAVRQNQEPNNTRVD